jgi:hypothetical protein
MLTNSAIIGTGSDINRDAGKLLRRRVTWSYAECLSG